VSRALFVDAWPGELPLCGSGLGSSLLKLPAAEDALAAGWEVDLLTSATKVELLAGVAVYSRRFAQASDLDPADYDAIVPLGLPSGCVDLPGVVEDPRPAAALKLDYCAEPHVAFWRSLVGAALGLPATSAPARMLYEVPQGGSLEAPVLDSGRPWVTLSLSALTHLKRYTRWSEVAASLHAAGAAVALVGLEPPRSAFPLGSLDLCRATTFAQLAAVLQQSAVVAGTDGLVTNLGVALGRPTVALFTIIRPDFVFDPALELRGPLSALHHPGCPLQPCYPQLGNYRHDGCPADPSLPSDGVPVCAEFSPQRVATAILDLL
jgi:hypothetical protein